MPVDFALARQQVATLQTALDALKSTLAAQIITLHPGQSLQTALDTADAGAVIELEPGIYAGPMICRRPVLVRPTVSVAPGRASLAATPVTIISGSVDTVTILGDDVTLSGLSVKSTDPNYQLINVTGARSVLDRLVCMGNPDKGQHRGICVNGAHTAVVGCYVDECWLPDRDAQALAGWSGTKDLWVSNCHLSGGAETVMFGGADSASPDMMPADILIENSDLTKQPAWYTHPCFIKNCFELKAARNVTVKNSTLQYAGVSGGQGGYIIQLTPRNQGGKAPWSTVENVLIENCKCALGSGAINFMGDDNLAPSGTLKSVTISKTFFSALDPGSSVLFPGVNKGQGRVLQFVRGPHGVSIEDCEFVGQNLTAAAYFVGTPPVDLLMRNCKFPTTKYGFKIDGGTGGLVAVKQYAPTAVFENVTTGGVALA